MSYSQLNVHDSGDKHGHVHWIQNSDSDPDSVQSWDRTCMTSFLHIPMEQPA